MTPLILFMAPGVVLLVLLVAALTRRAPACVEGSSQAVLDARQALNALQNELLPADLIERIFAKQDLDYVKRSTPPSMHEMFLEERRKVGLVWVRQVRKGVVSLRAFHRGQARHYARLSVKTELDLAASFAALLLACRALELALYFRGPYAAPQIVGRTVGVAARLCQVSEKSLAFLNADALAGVVGRSADNQAEL